MTQWTRFSLLAGTLLATAAGCDTSLQQQVVSFPRDFFLQALAAYLL